MEGREESGGEAGPATGRAAPELTLQSILDTIQDVFYRIDAQGRIEVISRSGAAQLGYGSPAELVGSPAEGFWFDPEQRPAMLEALRRDGVVRDWEARLRRRDGAPFWMATTVRLLRDAGGGEIGYEGIWRDVTERRSIEERLRQSEERFAQIFRMVPDIIAVSRVHDGLLLDVNPGFERATGWTRAEVVGRTTVFLGLWPDPETRDRLVAELRATGEVIEREVVFRRKDGTTRDGVFSARSVALAGEPCVVSTMRDVTEHRATLAGLRLAEQRSRAAIEGANLGTWEIDPATNVQTINGRWAEMLGWRAEEIPDPFAFWSESVHPDDAPGARAALLDHMAGRTVGYRAEFRMRHRDGHWVTVLSAGRATAFDAAGRATRVCGTHLDVTEQRRLEAEHARLEGELRQAQKLEAIGQVAGGVAHDFNNLLTVQLGAVMLLRELPGLPDEARELAGEIEASARAAAGLTRQLLAFGRRQVLDRRRLDLDGVVGAFAPMLRRLLREDVRLEVRLAGHPLWVNADAGMLEQVVMNLAVNARDAMPGGGTLTVGLGRAPGGWVALTVHDTGHGMDEETRGRVFEPFFTTKPKGQGTGLGLASVYGIVRQHGGSVEVRSRPGAGATFRVLLPEVEPPVEGAARPAEGAPQRAAGRGETILLVEDDAAVRRGLAAWLERLGYGVLECESGDEAFARWRGHESRIDLVLTDMVMPGTMSGRALADALRVASPALPVIVMSGHSADLASGGLPRGVGFLPKPVEPDALSLALRRALDRPAP